MSHDPMPGPPVPPIPHPEDVRFARERVERAICPMCQSEGARERGETVTLSAGWPRPYATRVCRVCSHVALFLG